MRRPLTGQTSARSQARARASEHGKPLKIANRLRPNVARRLVRRGGRAAAGLRFRRRDLRRWRIWRDFGLRDFRLGDFGLGGFRLGGFRLKDFGLKDFRFTNFGLQDFWLQDFWLRNV